jgi:hypothetical protein
MVKGNPLTMDIIHGSQMKYEAVPFAQRTGTVAFKRFFTGPEGSPEHYLFFLARQGEFYSPLHHHNFEQFRYGYRGSLSLNPDTILNEGELAYHPEGAFYGPQHDQVGEREVLLLQFGGASGQGYLNISETAHLQEVLKQRGRIEKGKFYPNDGGEPKDAYEAMWEVHSGRPIEYPGARYSEVIVVKPENYAWVPVRGTSNVYRKHLGTFTECESKAEIIKLDAGSRFDIAARDVTQLLFVLRGEGEAQGEEIRQESAIRLRAGRGLWLGASTGLEVLNFVLPDLHHLLKHD